MLFLGMDYNSCWADGYTIVNQIIGTPSIRDSVAQCLEGKRQLMYYLYAIAY